jgi:hypothetical protein
VAGPSIALATCFGISFCFAFGSVVVVEIRKKTSKSEEGPCDNRGCKPPRLA